MCIKHDVKQQINVWMFVEVLERIKDGSLISLAVLWNFSTCEKKKQIEKSMIFFSRGSCWNQYKDIFRAPPFQGVAHRQTNFTLSCVIPLWDSATAHSPSGKELILSSLEESCFSGLIVLLMFSHYPAWALFGLVLTHITH